MHTSVDTSAAPWMKNSLQRHVLPSAPSGLLRMSGRVHGGTDTRVNILRYATRARRAWPAERPSSARGEAEAVGGGLLRRGCGEFSIVLCGHSVVEYVYSMARHGVVQSNKYYFAERRGAALLHNLCIAVS